MADKKKVNAAGGGGTIEFPAAGGPLLPSGCPEGDHSVGEYPLRSKRRKRKADSSSVGQCPLYDEYRPK